MTLGDMSVTTLSALGIAAFLLDVMYMAVILRRHIAGLGKGMHVIYVSALLIGLFLLFCITEVSRCVIAENEPSVFEAFASDVNALFCMGTEAVMTALWAVFWLRQEMYIYSSLTPQSLEDGLNSMTDGVAFVSTKGVPLLVNSSMQRVYFEALGLTSFDSDRLEKGLQRNELNEGYSSEIRGKGYYLHMADGSVWDIQKRIIMIGRKKIWEILAYDVTERYRKSMELEERNSHLEEVNRSIRAYTREMNAIIREEEVLAAKIRIHDDVGRALLALKSYLIRGGDREALMEMWQFTAGLLRGENIPDGSADPIAALKEAADAVGVRLVLNGDIPEDLRKLIAIAIHECLTNTVKHADGTELTVDITDDNGTVTAVFTNDGDPPEGEISESGGLKSLRSAVEQVRGEMEIASDPRFMLTIKVGGKE